MRNTLLPNASSGLRTKVAGALEEGNMVGGCDSFLFSRDWMVWCCLLSWWVLASLASFWRSD